MLRRFGWICVGMVLGIMPGALAAEVTPRLAYVFQDRMVLQREMPVPVWGWAAPGATATVSFGEQTVTGTAGADGRWQATLAAMPASTTGRTLSVTVGDWTVARENVLVGEVWITAGQSNMVHSGPDRDTGFYPWYESAGADGSLPEIRIMRFSDGASLQPQPDIEPSKQGKAAPWQVRKEQVAGEAVNIPLAFARVLRDGVRVPVGIVHTAVPGTNQAAWMSRETLAQFPGKGDAADFYDVMYATQAAKLEKRQAGVRSWADFEAAMADWRATPKGRSPAADSAIFNFPTVLYNTRIHPLAPLAARGLIWHQGEGGPGRPYGERLVAQMRQYRALFGQDLYVIWGTLTRDTGAAPPLAPTPAWFYRSSTNPSIRRAEQLFGDDPRAALVELYDLGDHDTHWLNKGEAGHRFGLAALATAYGQDVPAYRPPTPREIVIADGKARVSFDHVAGGLRYTPSIDGISGVYVTDKDGAFFWGQVTVVDASTLEITHPTVAIVGVGYAKNPNPHETLFGGTGLPVAPFEQDLGRIEWSGHHKGPGLISAKSAGKAQPRLNVAHVRADGYVFALINGRNMPAGTTAEVRAYVSQDWPGAEVTIGGESLAVEPVTGADGRRDVVFQAPVDGSWIVVAAPGQAAAFATVNRY